MTYAGKHSNMTSFIDKIKFYKENICNFQKMTDIIQRNNVEVIFNFAAETHVDNSILSSELSRLNPRNPYSATKAAAEHLVTAYSETHGVTFKIVRMSNNFGPRQDREKFLPTIIKSIKDKNKIPVYGDGLNVRDWLYVKDGSELIYTIFERGIYGQTYNVTYNNEMTNIELIRRVTEIMNVDFDSSIQFVDDRPGHDFRYSIDNEKLRSLGIQPATNFRYCLKETIGEWR
jgi:dTDP-glucose 4,6-dehydratase